MASYTVNDLIGFYKDKSYDVYNWVVGQMDEEDTTPKKKEPKKSTDDFKDIFDPKDSRLDDPEMIMLLDSLVTEIQRGNTPPLYQFLGDLESRNNPQAVSKVGSTAKGVYQFTDPAVETSMRSAKRNVGIDHEYIDTIKTDPRDWSQEQANIMLSSYLFPHIIEGSPGLADELIRASIGSEYFKPEWEQIYDIILHTSMGKTRFKEDIDANKAEIFPKYYKP